MRSAPGRRGRESSSGESRDLRSGDRRRRWSELPRGGAIPHRGPGFRRDDGCSPAADPLGDLAGAVADRAGHAVMLTAAVAVRADILPGAGGAGGGLVARRRGFAVHGASTRGGRTRFRGEPQGWWRICAVMKPFIAAGAVALAFAASPASAQEMFGGVYAHDVDTPL